jgi:class 3 adenylate cyclase/tetratricopeptide (TPR) repeat protein
MSEDEQIDAILKEVARSDAKVVDLLRTVRGERNAALWQRDPRLYRAFAKRLIGRGHPTRAYELVREGLAVFHEDVELKYLSALALARGGNISKAKSELDELLRRSDLDSRLQVEARSLGGRLLKDHYQRAATSSAKKKFAAESARLYSEAHELSGEWFPGINAATMSLLAGDARRAKQIATAVIEQTRAAAQTSEDYWLDATLGEAHVLIGELEIAARHYAKAVRGAAGRLGDIASMRRNLQLIAEHLDVGEIPALFNIGGVVVFSGHMIDHPDRAAKLPARFPASPAMEAEVAVAIRTELERTNAAVGFSAAAAGSDILFAEQMLERGAELHIVLPFARDDFYFTSVDFGLPEMWQWRKRCDAVLERAAQVHLATEDKYLGDDVLLDFANNIMQGLAITRARELGVEPRAVVVVEPGSKRFVGGTAHFIERWKSGGREVHQINLASLRENVPPSRTKASRAVASASPPIRRPKREIHTMLFADVKNFSKLTEEQAPSFFVTFLNMVARVIAASKRRPIFANTWGDGLFLVFDQVVDCADFAMRLLDRIETIDWEKLGLPSDTTVRMGLHAGPVYPRMDKIIQRVNFFGSHVNRAARIEPVTTPGCAFTSDQFAALLAIERDHRFICEYVGVEQLAKEYARCALYRLARR